MGGWLTLVGLGLIVSPLRIIIQDFPLYLDLFSNGTWAKLFTFNPLVASLIIGEIAINVSLVLAWVFIAYLFFSKKTVFPKCYIGILLFTLAFILIDALAMQAALPNQSTFDKETIAELRRSIVFSLIWVPYMLISKRVKATFTK